LSRPRPPVDKVVAVDGGVRTGKTSVSAAVADRLGVRHINTGLVYRATAWAARLAGISLDDEAGLAGFLEMMENDIAFIGSHEIAFAGYVLNDEDLRTPEVSAGASQVGSLYGVRQRLIVIQRRAGQGGAVLDGRDIGTVIFPDAYLKIFLTVDVVEARRRAIERDSEAVALFDLKRDQQDAVNTQPATDAIVVDTSHLSLKQVVEKVLEEFSHKRFVEALQRHGYHQAT